MFLAEQLPQSSRPRRRHRRGHVALGAPLVGRLHLVWGRLVRPHLEQQMLVPSLGINHLRGLVSKLDDHAFWNGRWGSWQACRGKPLGGSVAGARENQCGVFSGSGWVLCDGDLSPGSQGSGPLEFLEHLNSHVSSCPGRVALRWKNISRKHEQGSDGCCPLPLVKAQS